MRSDMNLKMEETVKKIDVVSQRLGEAEQQVGEVETFSTEVNETLNQMQRMQLELKSKLTELEGHSRPNNIRIYGIKEGAEGTSMICFVENLIQTELGEGTGSWLLAPNQPTIFNFFFFIECHFYYYASKLLL